MSNYQPHAPALLHLIPHVEAAAVPTTPRASLPAAQALVDQPVPWVSLLLAAVCTLVVVGLFLAPLWRPSWKRRRARARMRRSDIHLGVQRFADAVACGDFDQAETEA